MFLTFNLLIFLTFSLLIFLYNIDLKRFALILEIKNNFLKWRGKTITNFHLKKFIS